MAEYTLLYHPDVHKEDLRHIPNNIKTRIKKAIENRLVKNPLLAGKPLKSSLRGYRKLRVGDWRIIYKIKGKNIMILKVGNRKEVYRRVFKRF